MLRTSGLFGQESAAPASPQQAPQAIPQATEDPDQEYSIAVEIEVVTVPVTVTDQHDEFVTDLDKSDFRVLDNGEPQKIEGFELSWEPLSMVILAQTSSRIAGLLPEVRDSGILFTQLILGETGEAAVVAFDREIKLVQDFSSDADEVENAIRSLSAGGEQVRLSDAVARAIAMLQRRPAGRRKVIVIISEGRDQGSGAPVGLVLRSIQQLGISVYTVGLSSYKGALSRASEGVSSPFPPGVAARPMPGGQPPIPDAQTNWGAANVNLLDVIAELVSSAKSLLTGNPLTVYAAATGGATFASGDKAKLEQALGKIGRELRSQYMLTYSPNNLTEPGFHTIRVLVSHSKMETRARPGYMFVPPIRKPASSGNQPQPAAESSPDDPWPERPPSD